jgi:2-methylcitrate dehydratase PrpD
VSAWLVKPEKVDKVNTMLRSRDAAHKAGAADFILGLKASDIPAAARHAATRALYDTLGVAAAALATPNSGIVRAFAVEACGPGKKSAAILFDGRRVSLPGAVMASSGSIDSLDAHDGLKPTKGHIGVVAVPALIAFAEGFGAPAGAEFMTRLVMAYEIAARAGLALHATVADYHTSGAWNALAAAAIGARAMGLGHEETRHALGIAEYNGPRSQMMRCIDHPTMLKDGATMGGFAGAAAALLAAMGHTGAPAITVERGDAAHLWADLGQRWYVGEQYIKPYPVCRWAQPAVAAALSLKGRLAPADIASLAIHTFHEATRLPGAAPANTEEAQYSIRFPVAAALQRGRIGVDEVAGSGLGDATIIALARRIELVEEDRYNATFPAQRQAHVEVVLTSGERLVSPTCDAIGDPETPFDDAVMREKFMVLAAPVLGEGRAARLLGDIEGLWQAESSAPVFVAATAAP